MGLTKHRSVVLGYPEIRTVDGSSQTVASTGPDGWEFESASMLASLDVVMVSVLSPSPSGSAIRASV